MTKKCKNRRIFFSSYIGYGVRKMTARGWGALLNIRTWRQNAYLFIFERVKGQKRVENGQKSTKNFFLKMKHGLSNRSVI